MIEVSDSYQVPAHSLRYMTTYLLASTYIYRSGTDNRDFLLPLFHLPIRLLPALDMAPSSNASFSSLPPELRVRIFRYVLPTETHLEVKVRVKSCSKTSFPGRLLSVSKIFNNEAAPLLYSGRLFQTRSLHEGMMFLRRIGITNSSHIEAIAIGSFSLTKHAATDLELPDQSAMEKAVDEIHERCPSLTQLSLRDVRSEDGKWLVKTLEKCRYLISKFPQMMHVSYQAEEEILLLGAESPSEVCQVSRCLLHQVNQHRTGLDTTLLMLTH